MPVWLRVASLFGLTAYLCPHCFAWFLRPCVPLRFLFAPFRYLWRRMKTSTPVVKRPVAPPE